MNRMHLPITSVGIQVEPNPTVPTTFPPFPLQSTPPLARGSVVPYRWLHRVRLPLPRNTRPALISPDLINRLQWLAVGPDVQVRRAGR